MFDVSSHAANAKSLNDNLDSWPNFNPNLVALVPRFWDRPMVTVTDVEKASLQIGVSPEDRDAQRFLWFKGRPEGGRPLPDVET